MSIKPRARPLLVLVLLAARAAASPPPQTSHSERSERSVTTGAESKNPVASGAARTTDLGTPRVLATGAIAFQESAEVLPATRLQFLYISLGTDARRLLYDAKHERAVGVDGTPVPVAECEGGRAATTKVPFSGSADEANALAAAARAQLPVEAVATAEGVTLRFPVTLNTRRAADTDFWQVELIGTPNTPVAVESVGIGTDDRSVFLPLVGLSADACISFRYSLRGAEGEILDAAFVATISPPWP